MSTLIGWPAFRKSLRQCIAQAWPEIDGPKHPIFWVTQVERMPWRNRLDTNRLEVPWVVAQIPPVGSEAGWGACNVVYRPRPTIFYVADNTISQDMTTYLEEKLVALDRVLVAQAYTGFQYWHGETVYDVSEDNAVNRVFLATNTPMSGASLTFRCSFGYVAASSTGPVGPSA